MSKKFTLASILIGILIVLGCNNPRLKGFEILARNFGVKLIVPGNTARMARDSKAMTMECLIVNDHDSLIDNAYLGKGFILEVEMEKESGKYDLMHAFSKLAEGDSVVIRGIADSLLGQKYINMEWPANVEKGSFISIHIRVTKVYSAEEYEEKLNLIPLREKAMAMSVLKSYLDVIGHEGAPIGSGYYKTILEKGMGKKPRRGDVVTINLIGRRLDSYEFDNTYTEGYPYEFQLGMGHDFVPMGIEEAIQDMQVGEKANIILPYYLAYGEKGSPPSIPPYSNLYYEVELIGLLSDQ